MPKSDTRLFHQPGSFLARVRHAISPVSSSLRRLLFCRPGQLVCNVPQYRTPLAAARSPCPTEVSAVWTFSAQLHNLSLSLHANPLSQNPQSQFLVRPELPRPPVLLQQAIQYRAFDHGYMLLPVPAQGAGRLAFLLTRLECLQEFGRSFEAYPSQELLLSIQAAR